MALYTVLITSILGAKGSEVELPKTAQTAERLKCGFIELKKEVHKPVETKGRKSKK